MTAVSVIKRIIGDKKKMFIETHKSCPSDLEGTIDLVVSSMSNDSWFGIKTRVVLLWARLYIKYLTLRGELSETHE